MVAVFNFVFASARLRKKVKNSTTVQTAGVRFKIIIFCHRLSGGSGRYERAYSLCSCDSDQVLFKAVKLLGSACKTMLTLLKCDIIYIGPLHCCKVLLTTQNKKSFWCSVSWWVRQLTPRVSYHKS